MFAKDDVKQLIESVNVGKITEDEKNILVEDVYKKLSEAFETCRKEAIVECEKRATEKLTKERVLSFKRGNDSAKESCENSIKEAETNAFEAGREAAIKEAEEDEEEVSDKLIAKIEEFCKEVDLASRLVEILTHEDTKEYFKESTKNAISEFIDKKITESFPKKNIVNYDRLNRLENLFESLKGTLLINDKTVCEARDNAKRSVYSELNEAKEGLKAQTKRRITAEQLVESTKAENYLLKRVMRLPLSEQKQMMNTFKGASLSQITESFDREYQKILRKTKFTTPIVNDVISESTVSKNLAKEAQNTQQVNESVDNTQKQFNIMDVYAENCKHIRM